MEGCPQAGRLLPALGLQRVNWVRILVHDDGTRCQVAGIAHRRPVLRTVPLRTATALMAAGVPGWVRPAPEAAAVARKTDDGALSAGMGR